jgi:hypothetical protein
MFGSIGAPELIVTLHRLRAGQQAMGTRLETIERLLQRR